MCRVAYFSNQLTRFHLTPTTTTQLVDRCASESISAGRLQSTVNRMSNDDVVTWLNHLLGWSTNVVRNTEDTAACKGVGKEKLAHSLASSSCHLVRASGLIWSLWTWRNGQVVFFFLLNCWTSAKVYSPSERSYRTIAICIGALFQIISILFSSLLSRRCTARIEGFFF